MIPWCDLCGVTKPFYPKPKGAGRPPVGLERMLRIHFLQHWFNLSDPAVEETLYDSRAMRRCVGIDLGREPVPDETTVRNFRHLLEAHNLGDRLFVLINAYPGADLFYVIERDRLAGLTSNPAIFEKAIARGGQYTEAIAQLRATSADRESLYEHLVLSDISHAADSFRQVYETSGGLDGYVSIEVSPLLARDAEATVAEARELWQRLDRPNVMIKVPGTVEGLPAVRQLLIDGINVNVTLLFSVGRYLAVLDCYQEALEMRQSAGQPLAGVASVASFFLSRIDVKVDAALDALIEGGGERAERARALRGQAAIASAAFAYQRFRERSEDERWQTLLATGARPQRLLWASTSSKDPSFSDTKYVEALIAPETVNTLPLDTLNAYRDHGNPEIRIEQAIGAASAVMHGLADLGIDMKQVDDELEAEGIEKFVKPYESLLATLGSL